MQADHDEADDPYGSAPELCAVHRIPPNDYLGDCRKSIEI
jgi:hypothetical protein